MIGNQENNINALKIMKRLLIIGASVLQLPGILKAKEMGLHVGRSN